MNSYALSVLIAIIAAAGTLAVVPTYASSFDQEACPDCSNNDAYTKHQLALQNELPIHVSTDKKIYDHNSEVSVSGTVANLRADSPVTITVVGPQNNVVRAEQVEVSADNTFETTFSTAGDLFRANGDYTVRVQYGPQQINDKVVIQLVGEAPEKASACGVGEIAVKGGGQVYCVPYEANGAVVTSATASSATKSLTLKIATESDGAISVKIPREVLDAMGDNSQDQDFVVTVDDQEADFTETDTTDSERTLEIQFSQGDSQIEIIGTKAVPEFGTMAAIILAVAIVSIVAITARTRLSISPRY